MYCPNCGYKLAEGMKFCPACGDRCLIINESTALDVELPKVVSQDTTDSISAPLDLSIQAELDAFRQAELENKKQRAEEQKQMALLSRKRNWVSVRNAEILDLYSQEFDGTNINDAYLDYLDSQYISDWEEATEDMLSTPIMTRKKFEAVREMNTALNTSPQMTQHSLNEKYKRLLVELENVRNRSEQESKRMYDAGTKEVLVRLLPVVDNFERALRTVPKGKQEGSFEQGVDKIHKQLMLTLNEIGVRPIEAVGTEFDTNFHYAVIHVDDKEYGENVVIEELQKGYMYKENVLRYSMVKVAN